MNSTFNPGAPGECMVSLLINSHNNTTVSKLSAIKSTDVATINTVLAESVTAARAASTNQRHRPAQDYLAG